MKTIIVGEHCVQTTLLVVRDIVPLLPSRRDTTQSVAVQYYCTHTSRLFAVIAIGHDSEGDLESEPPWVDHVVPDCLQSACTIR